MSSIATIASVSPQPASLRRRAVLGTLWTVGATYGGQLIRLGSNLVLSRLLFPEAFGLMAVVFLFIEALALFSELGVQQSMIQDPRGDDPSFADTAWTLQVIRCVGIWVATWLIGAGLYVAGQNHWLPADSAFADPRLVWLLPFVGLQVVLAGMGSTKVYTLRRHLHLGIESIYQLVCRLLSALVMVAFVLVIPSVWGLAVGTVVAAGIGSAISQWCIPGPVNRFRWDRPAAHKLIRFGRLILLSTSFTFLATGAQRVILGTIMPTEAFGLFAIAMLLCGSVVMGLDRVSENVLFPLYSKFARDGDADAMRRNVMRVRMRLMAVTLPPMWIIAVFGDRIVEWLYDDRYLDAGWMLQLLAAAGIVSIVSTTIHGVMLAHGDAKQHLKYTVVGSLVTLTSMAAGAAAAGVMGVLIGGVAARLLQHGALLLLVRRYRVLTPALDLAALTISAAVVWTGWLLTH